MTSRPDLSALSEVDRAWYDELGMELLRRDDVSADTAGRFMTAHREAIRALRADEAADGRAPEPLVEAFGSPESVVDGLIAEHPDDAALGAEERQTASLLAQCSGVAVTVGLYLVLIWPFQHLLGGSGGAREGFGLGRLVLFAGLIALAGGFWSAIRSYGLGSTRQSALGAVTAVIGLVAVMCAHLVTGLEGPWWLGMIIGVVLVVGGWHLVDAGGAGGERPSNPERWYRVAALRLALVHYLPRAVRQGLIADARELAAGDPWGELGSPSRWAAGVVESDPEIARRSHRGTGIAWLVLVPVLAGFAVLAAVSHSGALVVSAWSLFALAVLARGLAELRRAAHPSGTSR